MSDGKNTPDVNAVQPDSKDCDVGAELDDECSCDDCNGMETDYEPDEAISEPLPPHVARIGWA